MFICSIIIITTTVIMTVIITVIVIVIINHYSCSSIDVKANIDKGYVAG